MQKPRSCFLELLVLTLTHSIIIKNPHSFLAISFFVLTPFLVVFGQEMTKEQKQRIDVALPFKSLASPQKPRLMLVTNLGMRDGKPWHGSSAAAIPAQSYAIEQMGKMTGAYKAVFNNDVEMFRPENLRQFDAICFMNSIGVLFEDMELKASLLDFVNSGNGIVGIHDAIATFVQYPVYDQWPSFGEMMGGTENGGHPWDGEMMTIRIENPDSPLNSMFETSTFQIADQAFQLQEPKFRDKLHILMSIDVEQTGFAEGRRILPVRSEDLDFPMSWIRSYGEGRVFYSGLGHTVEVFYQQELLEFMLAGIQFALGDLEADTTPSADL